MCIHLSERRTVLWLIAVVALFPTRASGQVADSTVVCAPATAEAFLDVGNVRAKILNNGGLFWNGGQPVYEVPKGGGVHAMALAGLWLGGLVDGELRMAAGHYGPEEMWPGPRTEGGPSPETCAEYDRLWEITSDDMHGKSAAARYRVEKWPVSVGAPFVDVDDDGVYDPSNGDRPVLLGDQQLWWVMNDAGGTHLTTYTEPMQVEVRATAFAFDTPGAVGNSTFYRYLIRNTSTRPILQGYATLFTDADLGAAFDDYIGSDSSLGLGYYYNADDDDNDNYGTAPPAIGTTVLKRPRSQLQDGPADCQYPQRSPTGFTNNIYSAGGSGVMAHPNTGQVFYQFMQSKWRDGRPLTIGGGGWDWSWPPTRFVYPGDPVTRSFWSEVNSDDKGRAIPPSDRRMMTSLGPFCIAPEEEVELVIAIVWSRGSSNLDSVRQLKEDVAYIQSIRDIILTPRSLPERDMEEPEIPIAVGVYPNPAGADGATVRLSIPEALDVNVAVYDLLGRRVHVAAGAGLLGGGEHQWTLPTGEWAPGVYIVRIQAGSAVTTRRLVVGNGM